MVIIHALASQNMQRGHSTCTGKYQRGCMKNNIPKAHELYASKPDSANTQHCAHKSVVTKRYHFQQNTHQKACARICLHMYRLQTFNPGVSLGNIFAQNINQVLR